MPLAKPGNLSAIKNQFLRFSKISGDPMENIGMKRMPTSFANCNFLNFKLCKLHYAMRASFQEEPQIPI
jgi:hypothetical protein